MKFSDAMAPSELALRLQHIRAVTLALTEPLSEADAQAQSMPEASPAKWHLAHTTWFFETMVLEAADPGYRAFHPAFRQLFNSYYNGVGEPPARQCRGLITRPGLAEVMAYRHTVQTRVLELLTREPDADCLGMVMLGLQHEQQHQELILTDVLHLLSCNPLLPAYRPGAPPPARVPVAPRWLHFEGGLVEVGHEGAGFAFDNERPRQRQWLAPYALGNRLVTQGEWAEFVVDGGYRDPRWWLSAGWDWVRAQRIEAPLYWLPQGAPGSSVFTLRGAVPLDGHAPVVHISLYEADAYARWLGAQQGLALRLPTEAEWEHAVTLDAAAHGAAGNFLDSGALVPRAPQRAQAGLAQALGDVWQWTCSGYAPYPGFRPWQGAVGEYNGKFMANQYVLRGGSCATPRTHLRVTYRNFFPAETRWQFSGLRLARDLP